MQSVVARAIEMLLDKTADTQGYEEIDDRYKKGSHMTALLQQYIEALISHP